MLPVIIALCLPAKATEQVSTLRLALLVTSVEQRAAWLKVTTRFNQLYPDIHIEAQHLDNDKYHQLMNNWSDSNIDIFYGFAGQRLFEYVQTGSVHPITPLWQQHKLYNEFDGLQNSIQVNHEIYALPISYYQWGFYYNRKTVERLGLNPPKTWQEFIALCKALKRHDVYPLIFGIRDDWPAASWFSYLNLRLNGIEFHRRLLNGEESFSDPRLIPVFSHWKTLIDADFFHPKALRASDRQMLVYLYREEAVMALSGNFIAKHIDKEYRNDYDFFGFPVINPDIPRAEEAPTDILFINARSQNIKAAETFIRFMALAEIQATYNDSVGYISPNHFSRQTSDRFIQKGRDWLQSAGDNTMFLDRDSNSDFSAEAFSALADFMRTPDIETVTSRLEDIRKRSFPASNNEK